MSRLNLRAALFVNFVSCGLEFLSCAGFTYIPPLLRKSGLSESLMALAMGIGPLLGFIFVPYIGERSDNCRSKYGRRKPFLGAFCTIAALSFVLMPWAHSYLPLIDHSSPSLSLSDISPGEKAAASGGLMPPSKSVAVAVALLVVVFDFSSQVAFTPLEALLADMGRTLGSTGTEQLFQFYSFMVGIGGVFGYLITSLDWRGIPFMSMFGANTQEERVFLVALTFFLFTFTISMRHAKDNPSTGKRVRLDSKTEFRACASLTSPKSFWSRLFYLLCPVSLRRIITLPYCLKRLCIYQFFAWSGLMSYSLFFTDFVGEAVFHGDPSPEAGAMRNNLYDQGVRVGSIGLLVHCVSGSLFPILQSALCKRLSSCVVLSSTILCSTLSIVIMVLMPSSVTMITMSIFPGFFMGAMLSVPFNLVSKYHDYENVFLADSIELRGIGTDMAILDSMYFLAEFALTVFDSALVFIIGSTYAYMYATIVFGVVTLVLAFQIVFEEKQLAWMNLKATDLREQILVKNNGNSVVNDHNLVTLQSANAAELTLGNSSSNLVKVNGSPLEIIVDGLTNGMSSNA